MNFQIICSSFCVQSKLGMKICVWIEKYLSHYESNIHRALQNQTIPSQWMMQLWKLILKLLLKTLCKLLCSANNFNFGLWQRILNLTKWILLKLILNLLIYAVNQRANVRPLVTGHTLNIQHNISCAFLTQHCWGYRKHLTTHTLAHIKPIMSADYASSCETAGINCHFRWRMADGGWMISFR